MKIVGLLVAFFAVFFSNAQNSYYFADPVPSATKKVGLVSESYFGTYKLKNGTLEYQFDNDGLTLISTTMSTISRETVRETSQYAVRDGYIFGVSKEDSIPCILKEDYYFFGVRSHDVFVGGTSKNVLAKTNNPSVYVLNVFENGRYVPQILEFAGNKLKVSNFDYSGESKEEFGFVESKESVQSGDLNLVILKPKEADFERIKSQAFEETMILKK